MCGRFAQFSSRDDYFASLGLDGDAITFDPEPIGRYNVAPGTRVLLLHSEDNAYSLDPVYWGYDPEWWQKPPLINVRSETASTGRMFKPLFNHGRAIVPSNGWFEWKRSGNVKQPYFIHHRDKEPLFFAAIGRTPYGKVAVGDENWEGFVIVTAASDRGLVDIHDRMPLVLTTSAALQWLDGDTSAETAVELMHTGAVPSAHFTWYPVSKAVGSVKNQGERMLAEEKNPLL